ncbi:quinone oxidoreductase PIG3 isoform X2 [Xenopus tropicalis]|uniref:Quinone oxidoreductase PIG3 isoform X2 n=1 Tax=Xenopus tropicalis TaxID=8364 RepID=A0A8J1JKU2_XENTR|nr:quinone oxidoreductase PIG3 isoform X2 [Xenopus tropicalis]
MLLTGQQLPALQLLNEESCSSATSCLQDKMLAAFFDAPGGPETLYVKELAKPAPKEGEVLVKVEASALNRADLLQRRGKYAPPPGASDILGLEAAGTVVELGLGADGRWKVGDKVMALLSGGGNAEYATVPAGHLMPVPPGMSATDAAAIPEAWLTAFQLLHFVGKVQKGETVLIHAGASGVGTAAIQLCRLAGAVPIVTAGSHEKLQTAIKLGAATGFNYKEENFGEKCLKFTNIQGGAGEGLHGASFASLYRGGAHSAASNCGQRLSLASDLRCPPANGRQQKHGKNCSTDATVMCIPCALLIYYRLTVQLCSGSERKYLDLSDTQNLSDGGLLMRQAKPALYR